MSNLPHVPTPQSLSPFFSSLQASICDELSALDGQAAFSEDPWDRPGGGGGNTRVITDGQLIEKGGVNYACVYGAPNSALRRHFFKNNPAVTNEPITFYASGLSIVLHPCNPYVPIIHMNVRVLAHTQGAATQAWLGGGIDVTPHYIDLPQARWFHRVLKACCDAHDKSYYPRFSQAAADYFYLPHRQESRGIGGIFFDKLQLTPTTIAFIQDIGNHFVPWYKALAQARNQAFDARAQAFQQLRRARYAEFNLVYDKGTQFGFQSAGRTESILMTLPPTAQWSYNPVFEPNSPEAQTLEQLKNTTNWLENEN